jgi:hypothetical protein
MKPEDAAARIRLVAFMDAIEKEIYGEIPTPAGLLAGSAQWLDQCIHDHVRVRNGKVEVFDLVDWNVAEVIYALNVVQHLGYTPEWK